MKPGRTNSHELDDEEWTQKICSLKRSPSRPRLDEIEGAVEARAVFRREDLAMAGCIVTIGQDGSMQLIAGAGETRRHAEAGRSQEDIGPARKSATASDPETVTVIA